MTQDKQKCEKRDELKIAMDKVYAIGFRNGGIEMKSKILKKINRDWSLIAIKRPMDLVMKILKIIDKLPVPSAKRLK